MPDRDDTLVKTIARAFAWQDELIATPGLKVKTIAERERVGERYVAKHLPLAGLSSTIVRTILAGTQPVTLTADRLLKLPSLPLAWSEQAAMLGFDR